MGVISPELKYVLNHKEIQEKAKTNINLIHTSFSTGRRGSEWGYLDNTKHLFFWLCNMKQLNFRHFNSNS